MDEIINDIKYVNNEFSQNPYLDIHCIGKSPSGEGILFFYRTRNKVLYSGAIDACINDSILIENHIKKLDLICWTHPHKDHFEGIEILLKKYAGKNTKVIIPEELAATIHKHKDVEEVELFTKMATLNAKGRYNNGKVFLGGINKIIDKIDFLDRSNGLSSRFLVETYAPIDSIVSKLPFQESIDYNEYSIILVLKINGAKFIFTGDTIKTTINELKKMKLDMNNVIYVKIPHHGSESSIDFADLLESKSGIAVTTIFKDNGFNKTPSKKVIEKYLNKNYRVFSTNKSYCDNKDSKEKIGIISTRIEIPLSEYEMECAWDNKCIKEAGEILNDKENVMLVI